MTNKNEVLTNWVNKYSDDLFSWALHKTSKREVAEDLVQETFLSAFKGIENFKNESQPKTWLFRILNNKIIDYYRKNGSTNVLNEAEIANEELTNNLFNTNGNWKDPSVNSLWDCNNLLDNPDFNLVLKNCINKLPTKWSLAISAKYSLEKKANDICKELDLSSSNYWQIIHRAKLQLKVCIEKNWNN